MSLTQPQPSRGGEPARPVGRWRLLLPQLRRQRVGLGAAIFLLVVAASGILAPQLAPYDPLRIDARNTLAPPSGEHWFGTDDVGRDVFSRVIWGARISLRVGFVSAIISTVIGVVLGLVSGYYEGAVGFVILRAMDLLLAFPGILLALAIVSILGSSIENVMIAVGISAVPTFTRVVHGSVLSVKQNDYVEGARALGCRAVGMFRRHIFPNVLAPVIVLFTLQIGAAIFSASSLSFIGLGAQPPSPEWGAMVSRGRYVLSNAFWMSAFPGLAIALVVIAINVLGDSLRDLLDPRIR
ncbi:MAG: ABC transporter permease [Truepera sp.]|nr:ABC transporter permease [Truepera sp.]